MSRNREKKVLAGACEYRTVKLVCLILKLSSRVFFFSFFFLMCM